MISENIDKSVKPYSHGATPSPLQLQENSKESGAEVGLGGVELEEVSELPSEEAEVSELPLEEVSDEVLGWKECIAVLEITGRDLE